jgi:choline dehydrogenase-like flavoprotein
MITDLQSLPTGIVLAADLCIVGSGPAGLTLASEFANTKYQVIILEAGGFDYEGETQEIYQGKLTSRAYPVASSRLRMFGGTSGHWNGQCGILPDRHLKRRPGVTEANWPISFDQLVPYYRKANRLLELGNFDYDTGGAKSLAHGVGLSAEGPLAPFIWRRRLESPVRFGPHMRKDMENVANLHVFLHANATALIANDQASQIEEIQFSTLDGKKGVIRARCFVLACGGLEVPRLLLNTDDVQPFGLGNSRGMVGRYFMEHPNAIIGKLYLSNPRAAATLGLLSGIVRDQTPPIGAWKLALSLSDDFERKQKTGGGYYRFLSSNPRWIQGWSRFLSPSSSLFERIHALARFFDERAYASYRVARGYSAEFSQFNDNQAVVYIEFEQLPNWDSHVFLTSDRDRLGLRRLALDWRLTEQDIRTARALGEAIGREAYLSGWGRFRFDEWLLEDGVERSSSFGFGYHHIGTARMADDPQFGVVDPTCRLFGCDNLYIAGSAVFPTASLVNPTMTIVALAYRMADDLKKQLA